MLKIAKFELSLFGVNCYVVYDPATKDCAIIDPGLSDDTERNAMRDYIRKNGLKVEHLINTHLHIDHAFGNAFVEGEYGVKGKAHKEDGQLGRNIAMQAKSFGMREIPAPVEITDYLQEGDVIEIGTGKLHVLHVPGHSPGSVVLYDKEDGFLITGDVLFYGSIGRTDLPGGDYDTLIGGIREKLLTLPDSTQVFPGHGPATTIGQERSHNPFLRGL